MSLFMFGNMELIPERLKREVLKFVVSFEIGSAFFKTDRFL